VQGEVDAGAGRPQLQIEHDGRLLLPAHAGIAAMTEQQRAGHEIELGSRLHDVGDAGKALQADEGDVVGDIHHAEFADHVLDRLGDDDFAVYGIGLTVHETPLTGEGCAVLA
jgi:hypothetical protein